MYSFRDVIFSSVWLTLLNFWPFLLVISPLNGVIQDFYYLFCIFMALSVSGGIKVHLPDMCEPLGGCPSCDKHRIKFSSSLTHDFSLPSSSSFVFLSPPGLMSDSISKSVPESFLPLTTELTGLALRQFNLMWTNLMLKFISQRISGICFRNF